MIEAAALRRSWLGAAGVLLLVLVPATTAALRRSREL